MTDAMLAHNLFRLGKFAFDIFELVMASPAVNALAIIGKVCFDIFELGMSSTAIYYTFSNIRERWNEYSSLKSKISIIFFYLIHIAALVIATGLFGEYLLSISMTSLLVNATSFLNDLFEYVEERFNNNSRKEKLNQLKSKLAQVHINYENSALFLKDLLELKNELNELQTLKSGLQNLLYQLETTSLQDPNEYYKRLTSIANIINAKGESIENEQNIIADFYQQNGLDVNVQEALLSTRAKIQLLQNSKKEMILKISNISKKGNEVTLDQFKNQKSLEYDIKLQTILVQHFSKLIKAKDVLTHIEKQLQNIDKIFLNASSINIPRKEKQRIKQDEIKHLHKRMTTINNFIRAQKHKPIAKNRTINTELIKNSLYSFNKSEYRILLRELISTEFTSLERMIAQTDEKLAKKKEFLQAISPRPKKDIKHDFNNIGKIARKIIELENNINLSNIDEKHKLQALKATSVQAMIAIIISYFSYLINSTILEGISKVISLYGAVKSQHNGVERRIAQYNQKHEAQKQAADLKHNLYSLTKIIPDSDLRVSCVQGISPIFVSRNYNRPSGNLRSMTKLQKNLMNNRPVDVSRSTP